jgi:hypothetical protein
VSAQLEWRCADYGNSTSPRYLYAWNNTASANVSLVISEQLLPPISGTLRNLRVTADAIGSQAVYTILVNGVATALTVTLAASATSGADSTHSVAVGPMDVVSCQTVTSAAEAGNVFPSAAVDFVTS